MTKPRRITARATVNLHGLRAGATALVDPTDPRVAALLRTEVLVSEEPVIVGEPAAKTTRGRGAEKPQGKDDTPGEAEPAAPRARVRAASEASETSTD